MCINIISSQFYILFMIIFIILSNLFVRIFSFKFLMYLILLIWLYLINISILLVLLILIIFLINGHLCLHLLLLLYFVISYAFHYIYDIQEILLFYLLSNDSLYIQLLLHLCLATFDYCQYLVSYRYECLLRHILYNSVEFA